MDNVLDYARRYISRGWSVVPVERGGKGCKLEGWQNLHIQSQEVDEYFESDSNIGILLGEPSGNLTDVDLDSAEAEKVGAGLLPDTLTGGRENRPRHHLYIVSEGIRNTEYKDLDGGMIIEIRSTGKQTVVEPSIYPNGDAFTWCNDREPLEISKHDLKRHAARVATAALLLKHLPGPGNGLHDISLALIGFLAKKLKRPGWMQKRP
jgi:hypothetical protein